MMMKTALYCVALAVVLQCGTLVYGQHCPTPVACPPGYTGRFCDIVLCDQRGPMHHIPPHTGYPIDIVPYKSNCKATNVIPVDSHVDVLYVFVDGIDHTAQPTLMLTDNRGNMITPTSQQNDNKTLIATFRAIMPGAYYATFSAMTACVYQAHGNTSTVFELGFLVGSRMINSDMVSDTLTEGVISGLAGHINRLPYPGGTRSIEVFSDAGFLASYDWKTRFGCTYELYAGPIVCNADAYWWFKVHGMDENGFEFMRTDVFQCTPNGPTTTGAPMTTTTSICQNGGYYDNGKCACDYGWEGDQCQTPICFNGGSAVHGQCACMPNFTGRNCYDAMCTNMNPIPPFNQLNKTIVLLIQNTVSMAADIQQLQFYMAELIYNNLLQHPNFVSNYVIAVYDDQGASVLLNSNDPHVLIEQVLHLPTPSNSSACKMMMMQGITAALAVSMKNSFLYVLADAPPDISNSTINLQAIVALENTKNRAHFFMAQPRSGFCLPWSSPELRRVYELAEFSGGEAIFSSKPPADFAGSAMRQMLQLLPTAMGQSKIYERRDRDCTYTRRAYVTVDSHTRSFTFGVHGDDADILVYSPDGNLWEPVSMVEQRTTVVRQIIAHCPPGWMQYDNICFLGIFLPTTWEYAREACFFHGGSLAQILNPVRQFMFDRETDGNDYWTSLNDIAHEGVYNWNTAAGQDIPLGHAYLNWATGEPSPDSGHQKNCMAVKHNGTRQGKWYEIDCQTKLPFLCERPAGGDRERIPPGVWRVDYTTQFTNQSVYNKTCHAHVFAQTGLQAFFGFTVANDSQFNDMPQAEPLESSTTNRYVAQISDLNPGSFVDSVNFYDDDYMLIDSSRLHYRQNCAYSIYSDQFTCPKNAFVMMLSGHDDNKFTFNRFDFGVCVGGPPVKTTEADYGFPLHDDDYYSY